MSQEIVSREEKSCSGKKYLLLLWKKLKLTAKSLLSAKSFGMGYLFPTEFKTSA